MLHCLVSINLLHCTLTFYIALFLWNSALLLCYIALLLCCIALLLCYIALLLWYIALLLCYSALLLWNSAHSFNLSNGFFLSRSLCLSRFRGTSQTVAQHFWGIVWHIKWNKFLKISSPFNLTEAMYCSSEFLKLGVCFETFVFLSKSWKWQCHEIFDLNFFHKSNPFGPLIKGLMCFCLKIRFHEDIRIRIFLTS